MKVLFLDHPEADFATAMLFTGLRQELGEENIVDWPRMPHFHGENYVGPVPSTPNGTCSPYPWVPALPGRAWSDEEVVARIDEFVVLLASPRQFNTERLRSLIGRVGRGRLRRLAMLDGEDYTTIRWDLADEFKPDVYFKVSYVSNPFDTFPHELRARCSAMRVVGFPLASTFQPPWVEEPKTIDICFLGGGNWHGVRREGIPEDRPLLKPALEALLQERLPGTTIVAGNVAYEDYRSTLARSRIAVCVGGHGIEPVRTYEAMSCPGTLVIRQDNSCHLSPWPLLHGVNCVAFHSHEEVPEHCRSMLDAPTIANEISSRGNVLAWDHYTTRARARQFIDEVA